MKLRTRKRLLNMVSLLIAAAAVWVLVDAFRSSQPIMEQTDQVAASKVQQPSAVQIARPDPASPAWRRQLRRPLYDPPPPPKVVVKKQPRPVTVKLTGTVLEPENSQAFLRLANGSMALKRIGDQVTDDPRDGKITEIRANEILIEREEDEIRLQVEGS